MTKVCEADCGVVVEIQYHHVEEQGLKTIFVRTLPLSEKLIVPSILEEHAWKVMFRLQKVTWVIVTKLVILRSMKHDFSMHKSQFFTFADEEKKICRNIQRLHEANFSKVELCGLAAVDATLPLNLLGLLTHYTIVLLQFTFLKT